MPCVRAVCVHECEFHADNLLAPFISSTIKQAMRLWAQCIHMQWNTLLSLELNEYNDCRRYCACCTLDQLTTWHQFMIKVHNRLGLITIHPYCTCVAPTCKQACPWARSIGTCSHSNTFTNNNAGTRIRELCIIYFCNHTLKLASQCSWNCTLFGYRVCHDATAQA